MEEKGQLPSETLQGILKAASFCASIVGADVLNPDYRVNTLTILIMAALSVYFVCTAYTTYVVFEDDWIMSLKAITTIGSGVQSCSKMYTAITRARVVFNISALLIKQYKKFECKGEDYRGALYRSCGRIRRAFKVTLLIYILSICGVILVPLVLLVWMGQRHLVMTFLIPGLDPSTNFGFTVTISVHILFMTLGGFGLFAGDLFGLVFLTQPYLYIEILKFKVQDLNESSARKHSSREEVMRKLIDIVMWHKFYMIFNKQCNRLLHIIITAQVITSGVSMMLTSFILLASDWPGGYTYLLLASSSLYLYCLLGTHTEICNDAFVEEIYNINFYNLTVSDQKSVYLLLLRAQHPTNLQLVGVLPLSVNTGLRITKSVYSLIMMMVQLVKE